MNILCMKDREGISKVDNNTSYLKYKLSKGLSHLSTNLFLFFRGMLLIKFPRFSNLFIP